MEYQILLVEDDLENCDILIHYLGKIGNYHTTVAHNALEALAMVKKMNFHLILLDIILPGTDGIDLCVQLRKNLYCPIIFISCLDDEETIVRAMRMGGDDYLTKPFRYPILQAHMEAALRRMQLGSSRIADDIKIGNHTLSTREHMLIKNDEEIYLSPTEFELLIYFINNENTVLKFEEIYQYIWKKPSYGDLRTVFTHVRNLRKKLEEDPSVPQFISTVPRIGYRFSSLKTIVPDEAS
ncbi:MAG: response regulator with CheY-like receiver domain and winged-helix DNA-binding domain [Clostridia bacterium]|jgi:DNA-binding response OmpR family regulator|nr:response regulator with CheY-like receiver domain and winged-helix DNA-binding domain [Clostridia bacterium]